MYWQKIVKHMETGLVNVNDPIQIKKHNKIYNYPGLVKNLVKQQD